MVNESNNSTQGPFGDATTKKFVADLYAELYSEIHAEYPEFSDNLFFYFDNDTRDLDVVVKEALGAGEDADIVIKAARENIQKYPGPQMMSWEDDDGSFKTFIVLRDVEASFNPQEVERLLAGHDNFAQTLLEPNPPMSHPKGTPFWLDAYMLIGKHVDAVANFDRYDQKETNAVKPQLFADTFAAYAMFKKFGCEVIPTLQHYANMKALRAVTMVSAQRYTTPALQHAIKDIEQTEIGMRNLGWEDIALKAEDITSELLSENEEIKKMLVKGRDFLDPYELEAALKNGKTVEYITGQGFPELAKNWYGAVMSMGDLMRGIDPYVQHEIH